MTEEELTSAQRASRKQARILRILVLLSALAYLGFMVVRSRQAYLWYGDLPDLYPIASRLRRLSLIQGTDADQLRWLSYLLFVLLSILYLLAIKNSSLLHVLSREKLKRAYYQWVIYPYLGFGLLVLVFYPHISRPMDTIDYAVHARIQLVHEANPYQEVGEQFVRQEPLVNFMEARTRGSVYGPIWQLLSLVPAAAGSGDALTSIIAFKITFFIVGLLGLALIWLFHTRQDGVLTNQAILAGVTVAWNPLLHLVSHGQGHNDIVMAVFVAACIVALAFRKPAAALPALTLSVLVKFVTAPLLAPLLWLYIRGKEMGPAGSRLRTALQGGGLSAFITLVAILPFGIDAVSNNLSGRYGELVVAGGTSKLSVLAGLASRGLDLFNVHVDSAELVPWVGVALFLLWGVYVAIRTLWVDDMSAFVKVALESFLVYLTFVALPVRAQYAVPVVLVGGFLSDSIWHRFAVILTTLALLWDNLLLVYSTDLSTWEAYLHQLSHLVPLIVLAIYVAVRLISFGWLSSRDVRREWQD